MPCLLEADAVVRADHRSLRQFHANLIFQVWRSGKPVSACLKLLKWGINIQYDIYASYSSLWVKDFRIMTLMSAVSRRGTGIIPSEWYVILALVVVELGPPRLSKSENHSRPLNFDSLILSPGDQPYSTHSINPRVIHYPHHGLLELWSSLLHSYHHKFIFAAIAQLLVFSVSIEDNQLRLSKSSLKISSPQTSVAYFPPSCYLLSPKFESPRCSRTFSF